MRALMTNIQHVDIWAEAEAIFDPISDAEPITRRHAGVRHIAMRPRVAARSAMSGASWPATEAGECGHETLIAIPTSGGTPSTRVRVPGRIVRRGPSRFGTLAGATARQAGARKDNAYFTSAPSSPSSVALRRRVAGVSPMSGATRPGECSSSRSRIHSPLSTRVPAHYRLLNVSGSNYSVSVLRCCRRELGASRDTDGIHCP